MNEKNHRDHQVHRENHTISSVCSMWSVVELELTPGPTLDGRDRSTLRFWESRQTFARLAGTGGCILCGGSAVSICPRWCEETGRVPKGGRLWGCKLVGWSA